MALPLTAQIKPKKYFPHPIAKRSSLKKATLRQAIDDIAVHTDGVAAFYLSYFYSGITAPVDYPNGVPMTPKPFVGDFEPAGEVVPDGVFQSFQAGLLSFTYPDGGNTTEFDRKGTTEQQFESMEVCLAQNDYVKFNAAMEANQTLFKRLDPDYGAVYHNGPIVENTEWDVPDELHSWLTGQKYGTTEWGRLTFATAGDGDLGIIGAYLRAHEKALAGESGWADGMTDLESSIYLEEALAILPDFRLKYIHKVGNGKLIMSDSAGSHPSTHPEFFSVDTTYFMPWNLRLMAKWDPDPVRAADWMQVIEDQYDLLFAASQFTTYGTAPSWFYVYRATGKIKLLFDDTNSSNGHSAEKVRLYAYMLKDAVNSNDTRGLDYIRQQPWLIEILNNGDTIYTDYDRDMNPRIGFSATRNIFSCMIAHATVVNPENVAAILAQTLSKQLASTHEYWSFAHDPFITFITWDNLYWGARYLQKLINEGQLS